MKKAAKIILASFIAASLAVSSVSYVAYAAPGDDQGSNQGTTTPGGTGGGGNTSPGGTGGGGNTSSDWESEGGHASNTINESGTYTGGTYKASDAYYTALYIDGATVTLTDAAVDKTGGSQNGDDKIESTDACDFYGVNAALLVRNGAIATISGLTLTSDAYYGNGVYCYGESVVYISDSKITTKGDHSGGIMVTGGGTLYATNLDIETSGTSSAAIRTDKGGGTVVVDGGTYTTKGNDSPAVYSTADITVSNATLTANNAQAIVVEGKNSVTLNDCNISGNMTRGTSADFDLDTIMIYQSMSGDADSGQSNFEMTGGSITSNSGNVFCVTNTDAYIYLSGVTIINNGGGYLMRVVGNNDGSNSSYHGWGTYGSNGGSVILEADAQDLVGDIVVDTISQLDMTLENGSTFEGTVNIISGDGSSDGSIISMTIEEGCTWTLTGDCTLSSITCNGTINYNGHTITLEDGTTVYSESNPVPGSTVGTDDSSSGNTGSTGSDSSTDPVTTTTGNDAQSGQQTTGTQATSGNDSSSKVDGPGHDGSTIPGQSTTDVTGNNTTSTETVPEPITTETSDSAQQTGDGNIPDSGQQGQQSGETTTTATTPVQSEKPSTPNEGVVYGDISLDNSIDMGDVVLIARYTAGLFTPQDNQQILNADCNSDGTVDWTDVNILVNFNLGVINVLPYTG